MKLQFLPITATLLLGACATSLKTTALWERHNNMVLIHHIDGLKDHVEQLSDKKFTGNRDPLPKGHYYTVLTEDKQLKPLTSIKKTSPKKDTDEDRLVAVTKEMHALKRQLAELRAEKENGSPSETAKQYTTTQEDPNNLNDTSVADADAPRLSQ
jgi:hypothetical protein